MGYVSISCRPSTSIGFQMALTIMQYVTIIAASSLIKAKVVQLGVKTRSVSPEEEHLRFDFLASTRQIKHFHFAHKDLSLL